MNHTLLERLRGFQIPPTTPIPPGRHVVARLRGIDFESILDSPDFGFSRPLDARFGKMMVLTTSHLLGGDACGQFGYTEHAEMSVLLNPQAVAGRWEDATDLQNFLVGQASSKMSLQIEEETLFSCKLYAFHKSDLVLAFFLWRRQEAAITALDRYCTHILLQNGSSPEIVRNILEGLAPLDKEEVLRQNNIEYRDLPAWQRYGTGVYLADNGSRVVVDTNLPEESAYSSYLMQYIS